MRIGIEAERANHEQKTGVEHYAKQLILQLAEQDRENSYVLYLRTPPQDWLRLLPPNFSVKLIPFPLFWTQLRISWEMIRHPVDLLFVPASALPIFHAPRSVITIHDVAWVYYPKAFTWFMRQYLRISTSYAVRAASKIIAVSEATKSDLIRHYGARTERIRVIFHGYDRMDTERPALSAEVANRLPEKYVLFLSTLQPRKNLPGLIRAFRLMKNSHPELPHKLVIAGKPGWKFQSILRMIQDNEDMVVYLNHISDSDRYEVYRRADLFVMPSFYEGFGMWLLEAFDAGVPAAVSRVSSIPEVGGEAALYFDPHSDQEISEVMTRALKDEQLRHRLVERGRTRLKSFGWERCGRETLEVFNSLNAERV